LPQQVSLTADEQKLNDVWNEHLRAEFNAHSADETVATMVAEPLINEVPVMIGGHGKEEVYRFMPNIVCPRFRRISRLSQCPGPSAKEGWSMR
jgi:carboxymethylenebutenolidase